MKSPANELDNLSGDREAHALTAVPGPRRGSNPTFTANRSAWKALPSVENLNDYIAPLQGRPNLNCVRAG